MVAELVLSVLAGVARPQPRTELLGHSAFGRPIRAVVLDDPGTDRAALVVGCIHGNECAGRVITRRLVQHGGSAGVDLWIVRNLNPDGFRLHVRQNGRGVDLNRNFRWRWRPIGRRWDPTYSGPRPFSEPESRLARSLILRTRPAIAIWYHQPQALVRASPPNMRIARRYARLARMPFRRLPTPPGAATGWQTHRLPGTRAFVVELPPGPLSTRAAARHARAVLRLVSGS